MLVKQRKALEAFVRVQAFLEAHPATGALSYAGARQTLDEVVRRVREHAGAQITGRELSRAELRRQAQLTRQLFDRHMRPIVTIARAQIEPDSDVRMHAALRMPPVSIGVTKVLQACDGMIEAVRPFLATFVANGLPEDFLARFTEARNALENTLGGRATLIGTHVGARTGLEVQMRRGRRAVDRLDAVVRASFDGDQMTLAKWRSAKRFHQQTGVTGARATEDAVEVPPVPQAAA